MKEKTFVILLAFLHFQDGACENQFFRLTPEDREAVVGENVEFHCHIGNRAGDVQWSKDGFLLGFDYKIPGYPRYFMDVDEEKGIYNLRIQNVDIVDEGEFQCQVGPAVNNTPIRAGAHLKILIAPSHISINDHTETAVVEVKENASVRLKCETIGSRPPAQLKWHKNNSEVPKESVHQEEKEINKKFVTTSYLAIRPTIEDNNVMYSCESFHRALHGKQKTQIILSVLHPPSKPQVYGYTEGTVVIAGDALTLMCVTQGGNPIPDLIWYRGNAQIDASYYPLPDKRTANNLTFTVTSTDNGGAYHCQASNIATRDTPTATIRLTVYHLASKLRISGPEEAARGETVTVYCVTDISNPKSSIVWTIDGKSLDSGIEDVTSTPNGWITSSNLTITLTRQEPDLKVFTCTAENPEIEGKIVSTHKMRVAYPPNTPKILGYDAGSSLKVGQIQRFTCVALGGNPPATLKWFKGDREISSPVTTTGSGVTSELMIRAQLNDNGAYYRCEAHNLALRKPMSAFVRLAVLFPASFVNISILPMEPRSGDNVTLSCSTGSSNPLSRISWKKDGSFLRHHSEETMGSVYGGISTRSRYSFVAKASDDGSLFTCQAKNDIFNSPVTRTVTLRVRHKPVFRHLYQTVEIEEFDSKTANVTAQAYPELVAYTWYHSGERLSQDSIAARVTARGSLFHVRNASRMDSGNYQCVAENEEGLSNATVILNVLYGVSSPNVSVQESSASPYEGQSATFECTVDANPVKPDMIKWRMKGTVVKDGHFQILEGGKRSIFKVYNVSREMRGSVECMADNGVGQASSSAIALNVLYRPFMSRSSGYITESTGRLQCAVDATGNVTITWLYNGDVIRSKGSQKYLETLARHSELEWISTLTITNVTDSDYGMYICTASNTIGENSAEIHLSENFFEFGDSTTAITLREFSGRFYGPKFWWIPAAAVGVVLTLLSCILILCCMRKKSNRTSHEGCRRARRIDIGDLTADEVCNKLLLSADVKSLLLCAAEKQNIPLQDFKEHSVFSIEDAYSIEKVRTRHFAKAKSEDEKDLNSGLRETLFEEIAHSIEKAPKDDCPDILRNEKGLCLTKDTGDPSGSPQSGSPESPRFASTPSGSTGSCLSVYHEKVPLRALGADLENPDVMKLHPLMVLAMSEDAFKYPET